MMMLQSGEDKHYPKDDQDRSKGREYDYPDDGAKPSTI